MGKDFTGKTFAVWGLAFKPGTDDMREAPSLNLIKYICDNGGKVNAYDPKAIQEAKKYLKDYDISYHENKYQALENIDALFLVTEWKEFRSPDFHKMKELMASPIIFDGRNQYSLDFMRKLGFDYQQIGVKA
jgi:UDPglucose 6-dehydrogenase